MRNPVSHATCFLAALDAPGAPYPKCLIPLRGRGLATGTGCGHFARMTKEIRAREIETWVIDLDNTLYHAEKNLFPQIDQRISGYLARFLGIPAEEAQRLQKQYWREYGTTLKGIMTLHEADPQPYLDFVHDIDLSDLAPDPELDLLLAELPGEKIIFTNGSAKHAENVMAKLEVSHHFRAIFDIRAAQFRPKPDPAPYADLVRQLDIRADRACMVDDMAGNLAPAHGLGMKTVWIKTGSVFSGTDGPGDHVHHIADDFLSFLKGLKNQ